MVVSIYPASQVRTDFNLEGFFPEESPTIQDYQLLSQEFGRDDNLIAIAFETSNVLDSSVLQDLRELTESIELIENVTDVFSLWNANEFRNEDGQLLSEPYLTNSDLSEIEQQNLLERLNSNPFTSNILINEDGTVTSIIVELDDTLNSYPVRSQVINDIQEILEVYRTDYDFRIAGIPFFRNQYVDMLNEEIMGCIGCGGGGGWGRGGGGGGPDPQTPNPSTPSTNPACQHRLTQTSASASPSTPQSLPARRIRGSSASRRRARCRRSGRRRAASR